MSSNVGPSVGVKGGPNVWDTWPVLPRRTTKQLQSHFGISIQCVCVGVEVCLCGSEIELKDQRHKAQYV